MGGLIRFARPSGAYGVVSLRSAKPPLRWDDNVAGALLNS